jgi:hypothetical protein
VDNESSLQKEKISFQWFFYRDHLKRKLRPVKGKDLLPAAAKKMQHNSIKKNAPLKEHLT